MNFVDGALIFTAGMLLMISALRPAIRTIIGDTPDYRQRIIDQQWQTIKAMDRTIRLQWEANKILHGRLGEPPDSLPVSITGLPEPEEKQK